MTALKQYVYSLTKLPVAGIKYIFNFLRALGLLSGAKVSHFTVTNSPDKKICTVNATFYFPPGLNLGDEALFPLVLFRTKKTSMYALCAWLLIEKLTASNYNNKRVEKSLVNSGLKALKKLQAYPDFDEVARICVGQFADKLKALCAENDALPN